MVNYVNYAYLNPPENTQQIMTFDGISENDNIPKCSFGIAIQGEDIMKFSKKKDESYNDYYVKLQTIISELQNFSQHILQEHII